MQEACFVQAQPENVRLASGECFIKLAGMKPVHNSRNGTAWCLLWMLLWAVPAFAAELTALALIQESNQHVGAEARDQVLQLRSEKSVAGLTPRIWYVLHYDRAATMRATEVKFGGGEMLQVARPSVCSNARMLRQSWIGRSSRSIRTTR
jgi:hypothetical protein